MDPVQGYVIVVVMFSVHPPDLGEAGWCLLMLDGSEDSGRKEPGNRYE
jgi:hypothetical protein